MSQTTGKKIGSLDIDVMLGDLLIKVMKLTVTISDNRQAVVQNGVPIGYVDGDVSAKGELEVDTENFQIILAAAKSSGSWRGFPAQNLITLGKNTKSNYKIEAYGCLFNISDLLDMDDKGGSKLSHKLPFEVTSPDFIKIDGIPYLSADNTRDLPT